MIPTQKPDSVSPELLRQLRELVWTGIRAGSGGERRVLGGQGGGARRELVQPQGRNHRHEEQSAQVTRGLLLRWDSGNLHTIII